jgi:hypothetical protein
VDQVEQQVGSDLVAGRTERSPRDRLVRGQRQTVGPRFVPEAVEEVLVPTTVAVGDHVEQESRQQLRRERAAAREVPGIATEAGLASGRENA